MRPAGAWEQPGSLVALPAAGRLLDGFCRHGSRRLSRLLVYVHGMGGGFHHGLLKKTLMARGAEADCDVLSFDNRGAGEGVRTERFTGCLADLDAALAWGRSRGYRRFILAGHSTGCQKIVYYQAHRKRPEVEALALLAPGDDYAITRRDMGPKAVAEWVARARRCVAAGRGAEPLPAGKGLSPMCAGYTAARFLSIADPRQAEAALFNYEGPMRLFSRLSLPILALFGTKEEYACLPPEEMLRRLEAKTASVLFRSVLIRGADHGFHGKEHEAVEAVLGFIRSLPGQTGRRA